MTPTPHDAALEAATKAFGHGVLDNIGRDNSIDEEVDCLLVAIQAYLRSLCADARVVENVAKSMMEYLPSNLAYNANLEDAGSFKWATDISQECAKAALAKLCEMGGVK